MPPDFLKNERRKNTIFLEKLIPKETQKNFIVNNNNKIIRAWYQFASP